jgi:hypothetical protein
MAYQESPSRVNVEFLKSSAGCAQRVIKLNHSPLVPSQLQGRIDPGLWGSFMTQMQQLADRHPYVVKPSGSQMLNWVLCGLLGAIIGLCAVNPDGGDYSAWTAEVQQALQQFRDPFAKCGLALSLQAGRQYWVQIDISNVAVGYPVG